MVNKKVKNLLKSTTEEIDYQQLRELKLEYLKHVCENPFPEPPLNPTTIDMIRYMKRKDPDAQGRIGPYEHITVFEAANRIASDLVLINGILQLIEEGLEHPEQKISLCLGTKHIKEKGDFSIGVKQGEAFNVASSFYSSKLQKTLNKWNRTGLAYILVNHDVFDQDKSDALEKAIGTRIVGVKSWDSI